MNAEEIIIMLLQIVKDDSPLHRCLQATDIAENYLREHGWRTDSITGKTWIKEGA